MLFGHIDSGLRLESLTFVGWSLAAREGATLAQIKKKNQRTRASVGMEVDVNCGWFKAFNRENVQAAFH